MRKINIPVFVPHKGCPNDCIFCNQKKITGVDVMTPEKAEIYIDECVKTLPEDALCSVAFFGGSFTAIDKDLQESFLKAAEKHIKSGKISYIRISTRPDCITKENLSMLYSYGVRAIELGVQSTDDEVLRLANRGCKTEDVKNAVSLIKEHGGFELGLQMMTGLPGDTREKTIKTAEDIISFGADTTRIYPTLVIENSKLADMFKDGEYAPLTLEEAVDRCADLYELFSKNGVSVLRMGLMASDEISENSASVLAGPVHSAFGELVHSRIFLKRILPHAEGQKTLLVYVNPKDTSKALGNKKCNIKHILDKTGCQVSIYQDSTVSVNEIKFSREGNLCTLKASN